MIILAIQMTITPKNGQSTDSTVVAGEQPLRIIINENTESEHPCGEWFYYWQWTQDSQTRQLSDRKLNALIKKKIQSPNIYNKFLVVLITVTPLQTKIGTRIETVAKIASNLITHNASRCNLLGYLVTETTRVQFRV